MRYTYRYMIIKKRLSTGRGCFQANRQATSNHGPRITAMCESSQNYSFGLLLLLTGASEGAPAINTLFSIIWNKNE